MHSGQNEVRKHPARFKVLACGRRWGKTRLGTALCLEVGLNGGRAWWVAPSYKMGEVGWRGLQALARQLPSEIRQTDRRIDLPGGGVLQVRSADDPQSLRGEGLDFVVLDECAYMRFEVWNEVLRPALSDRLGGALFISTPKGHNWFWQLWQRNEDDWRSWQFPTSANPYIQKNEVEAARRSLPERVFQQEYEAIFLDDAGGVFRRVMDAATGVEQGPQAGRQYLFGVDWGKSNDFTVITVIDIAARAVVNVERFNQIDYALQTRRLKALRERYNPVSIIAESNAMGEPLVEQLWREGLPVQPFATTNATKAQVIDSLAMAFERGEITILNDATLINELQAYEMERLPSGLWRYGAPEGMHDDCVMSLALAWSGLADAGGILL